MNTSNNQSAARAGFRLKQGLLYAGMGRHAFSAALVDLSDAMVYDTRDNAEIKAKFFSALLGGKFEVEPVQSPAH